MLHSPFNAYFMARNLENLSDEEKLPAVFASSDIKVYPFQVAAAHFALRSPYQKGFILCDESGMGKSHEAMMVITQKWYEGKNRILLAVPNADLLSQWVELIDQYYTIPYVVLKSNQDLQLHCETAIKNVFSQDALIIATYDLLAEQEPLASSAAWDLTVFEEATALSTVYMQDNKKASALKRIAKDSCKLLLTGTPIEKNIMDLYGLIYFIDETVLPGEQEFLQRYLRRPENYPELSEKVSKYCFRTLRSQAKQYAQIPNRIHITYEYSPSVPEQELYERLYAYCQKEQSAAFPEMNAYDLSLRLLGILGSSTAAILQTINGIIKRLDGNSLAIEEIGQLREIEGLAKSIPVDSKTQLLLEILKKAFPQLRNLGTAQKAVIFTESAATQNYLYRILSERYKTVLYNGLTDYSSIQSFQTDAQILISTDLGARGFNLTECSFVIQYDLLYNTLKMEQRIDRCHRLGQKNDVLVLSFINKHNFADVRKLELVNKRMLVADGVLGLSDEVVGGFTDSFDVALASLSQRLRSRQQIEADYSWTLSAHETENKQLVASAEEILFTTFTKQLADKLKIAPKYIEAHAEQLNENLWQLVKWFFEQRNQTHDDCYFEIDERNKTVTATNYEILPTLFYYWTGSQNKKYQSLKTYVMARDFKPHHGRVTFTSVIGRGIIHEIECADSGTLTIDMDKPPCQIALYLVEIRSANRICQTIPMLIGKTQGGELLSEKQCEEILSAPTTNYTEDGRTTASWLRTSSKSHPLDKIVPVDALLEKQTSKLNEVQTEEAERIKRNAKIGQSDILHSIDDLQLEVKRLEQELHRLTGDRMKTITVQRQLTLKRQELLKKQDSQFFEAMQLDMEIEKKVNEFLGKEKLSAKVVRQFVVEVNNTNGYF